MSKIKKDEISLLDDAMNIYPGIVYVFLTHKTIQLRALYFYSKTENHFYIYCFDFGIYAHAPTLEDAKTLLHQIIKLANKKENSGKRILPANQIYEKTFLKLIAQNKILKKTKRTSSFPKNAKMETGKDLVALICA
jgi:predicted RNase H-like HicB family nuclease